MCQLNYSIPSILVLQKPRFLATVSRCQVNTELAHRETPRSTTSVLVFKIVVQVGEIDRWSSVWLVLITGNCDSETRH